MTRPGFFHPIPKPDRTEFVLLALFIGIMLAFACSCEPVQHVASLHRQIVGTR